MNRNEQLKFANAWKKEHEAETNLQKYRQQLEDADRNDKPTVRLEKLIRAWDQRQDNATSTIINMIATGVAKESAPSLCANYLGDITGYVADCYAAMFDDHAPKAENADDVPAAAKMMDDLIKADRGYVRASHVAASEFNVDRQHVISHYEYHYNRHDDPLHYLTDEEKSLLASIPPEYDATSFEEGNAFWDIKKKQFKHGHELILLHGSLCALGRLGVVVTDTFKRLLEESNAAKERQTAQPPEVRIFAVLVFSLSDGDRYVCDMHYAAGIDSAHAEATFKKCRDNLHPGQAFINTDEAVNHSSHPGVATYVSPQHEHPITKGQFDAWVDAMTCKQSEGWVPSFRKIED